MPNNKENKSIINRGPIIRGEIITEGTKITISTSRPSLTSKQPPKPSK